jgi:DNA-directed RNA polymerase subunit RPC12/RpoP
MDRETRICVNCKSSFVIETDDFSFYEKIKVSPPTFCPECRSQRRFIWRNERTLHKRECDLCKKGIIGLYPAGVPFPVYCYECWYSDQWDGLDYGIDYEPGVPFFTQLKKVLDTVPRLAIWIVQSTNSPYTNQSYSNKNCYLSYALRDSEDSAYITRVVDLKKSFDCLYTHHSDTVYQTVNVEKSYRSAFVDESEGAVDSYFISNSKNCQQCLGGVNLRSSTNVFFGQQMSKEDYKAQLAEFDMGSRAIIDVLKTEFQNLKMRSPMKFAKLINCQNTTGDHVTNARNCQNIFDGFELENCKYSMWIYNTKETYDSYGLGGSEFVYETMACEDINNVKLCNGVDTSSYVDYSMFSQSSTNLFGCVGLKSKEYCILNKPLDKETYTAIREQIIAEMSINPYQSISGITYGYGEFFPPEFSPYAYNQAVAQEVFPLSRDEAIAKGYMWHDEAERNYNITIQSHDLPDNIKDVDDSILKEVIGCAHGGGCTDQCTTAFRIVELELVYLRQMNLPLPTLCPNCRHFERIRSRNPLKLWRRTCQCAGPTSSNGMYQNTATHIHEGTPCQEIFETSYAPERNEIVYCEKCYQAEVL